MIEDNGTPVTHVSPDAPRAIPDSPIPGKRWTRIGGSDEAPTLLLVPADDFFSAIDETVRAAVFAALSAVLVGIIFGLAVYRVRNHE